jgi:SAM-dependent methyltransferase
MEQLPGLENLPARVRSTPSLEERASWITVGDGTFELPVGRSTTYLTHGLFRYAGKLPPPLVALLLSRHSSPGDLVVDPMCGGGTTLIEAVSSGRNAVGLDINPVSLLVSEALSTPADLESLSKFSNRLLSRTWTSLPPAELVDLLSPEAYGLMRAGLDSATSAAERTLVLSIARKASYANTKKINTVVDKDKTPQDPSTLLLKATGAFLEGFTEFGNASSGTCRVQEAKATSIPLDDSQADFALLHPPYLTNTAFSELTHIQLILLGHKPLDIRESELAYRGSYFHVPDGLKKYLLGWSRILSEAVRILRPGGRLAVIVGDGRIQHVRIPIGTITVEFAHDLGLRELERFEHLINNQTGWTLSRRMTGQHVVVFEK